MTLNANTPTIRELVRQCAELEQLMDQYVIALHDTHGWSFTAIGDAMQVSRQSARGRYLRAQTREIEQRHAQEREQQATQRAQH